MREVLNNLFVNQGGQGLMEYGLIISLVILVVVITLQAFGVEVEVLFDLIEEKTSEII